MTDISFNRYYAVLHPTTFSVFQYYPEFMGYKSSLRDLVNSWIVLCHCIQISLHCHIPHQRGRIDGSKTLSGTLIDHFAAVSKNSCNKDYSSLSIVQKILIIREMIIRKKRCRVRAFLF